MHARTIFLSAILLAVAAIAGCAQQSFVDPAKQKAYATELLNRQLYAESAAAYDEYVVLPSVSDDERMKVLYAVANTLMTDGKLYNEALLRFLKLHAFYPEFREREVNAGIVQCFERTGRSLEAQLALEQSASLERRGETTAPGGDGARGSGRQDHHRSRPDEFPAADAARSAPAV